MAKKCSVGVVSVQIEKTATFMVKEGITIRSVSGCIEEFYDLQGLEQNNDLTSELHRVKILPCL